MVETRRRRSYHGTDCNGGGVDKNSRCYLISWPRSYLFSMGCQDINQYVLRTRGEENQFPSSVWRRDDEKRW